ncbi:MAG: hypothetical protein ABI016_04535 [Chthoniobacterales bacterium]
MPERWSADELKTLLQIVPRLPGTQDGVGDYALNLAQALARQFNTETIFAVPHATAKQVGAFAVRSFDLSDASGAGLAQDCEDVLLHYVNYGYHVRGVPRRLPGFLQTLRQNSGLRMSVIFHELFAEVRAPWRSAFWLKPLQIRIAREIAALADVCFVSGEVMAGQLQRITQPARISIHPVMSNFGEPVLSTGDFATRDPHRWVICGGTALVARSVRSFAARLGEIPEVFSPRELFVLGGRADDSIQADLARLRGLKVKYFPEIEASEASRILSSCSFGWLDYFHETRALVGAVLKSTAFAAYCAHGVIPVFPHAGSSIQVRHDRMPGPFSVGESEQDLPSEAGRAQVAQSLYDWYQRNASSQHLAATVHSAMGQPA